MEAMGAEGHWTSLSGVYTAEEADFMDLLLNNQIPNAGPTLQNFWPPHHHPHHHESSSTIMNSNFFSLELSNNSNSLCSNFSRGAASASSSADYSGGNSIINIAQPPTHSFDFFRAEDSKPAIHSFDRQRQHDGGNRANFAMVDQKIKLCPSRQEDVSLEDSKRSLSDESSAKRARSIEKVDVGKKSKKKPKLGPRSKSLVSLNGDHGNNNGFGPNGHCSSSTTYCSADESIDGGQATSGGDDSSLSLSPKEPNSSDSRARARRGSATDPQSLYARKRRERINERLKVLQNLVPNGTKVDISTMLEEAVQYVTFLKLQIKLLSSDELWMYAPIAYNGKDIGLDHNLKLRLAM